jgi:hypothetical protein
MNSVRMTNAEFIVWYRALSQSSPIDELLARHQAIGRLEAADKRIEEQSEQLRTMHSDRYVQELLKRIETLDFETAAQQGRITELESARW